MSRKSFEAGMEAGAKPFEEKFQKQADAFDKTADRLDGKLDDIKSVTDTLVDDGLARERKEVFGLNTLFDINNMEDTEKILVVSLLYSLAQRFEANDYQRSYIRSVQKYLGLKNIQPADTLTGVENVKDTDSQKAILQVMMEYLFLDGFSFDFLDEEEYEELFDSFNVNRKGFREVENAIENIYQAVGAEGLAEKYGNNDAEADESESEGKEKELPKSLDLCVIERELVVHEGETTKFVNKELVFEKSIICAGTVVFENCCIRYNEEGKSGHIVLENNGQLELVNCDVYCNEYRNEAFIIAKEGSTINISKTLFYQCVSFCSGENMSAFSIRDCSFMECWTDFMIVSVNPMAVFVLENSEFFFNTFSKMLVDINNYVSIIDTKSIFKFGGKADISNITVNAAYRDVDRKTIKVDIYPTLFNSTKDGAIVLRNSRFIGAQRITNGKNTEIRNCRFDRCEHLYGKIFDCCAFVECQHLATAVIYNVDEVVNCVFSSCKAPLFSHLHTIIRKCAFYNVKIDDYPHFIEFSACENRGSPGEICDCVFDGIRIRKNAHGTLIACDASDKSGLTPAYVKNCKFYNAISDIGPKELIKRTTMVQSGFFGNKLKPMELVSVSGNIGDLTAVPGTYLGSNPSIPTKDDLNRPIGSGAKLNTEIVGVQLANQGE